MMISVRRSAGSSRGQRGSTPSSRLRSRASRMARNLRLIESLWRYGIGGNLARFGCNLTRSVYLTLGFTDVAALYTAQQAKVSNIFCVCLQLTWGPTRSLLAAANNVISPTAASSLLVSSL